MSAADAIAEPVDRPAEESRVHTRLLKCALELEETRAWWAQVDPDADQPPDPEAAFHAYWFGDRSMARIRVLFTNMRARYGAFPDAARVLHRWRPADPDTRLPICHWHLQLSDPLYREFTGRFLVQRRDGFEPTITRDRVVRWVSDQGPGRWTTATRIQFASKLLGSAYAAGLVGSTRDPRPLRVPRVSDAALTYLLYLLRQVDFDGTMMHNPYLASVGLDGGALSDRLRGLDALRFGRSGNATDFGWCFDDLRSWAAASVAPGLVAAEGDA